MMFVRLPWPPRILHPNETAPWRVKAPVIKKYRLQCGWLAREAGIKRIKAAQINSVVKFIPPDRRWRDEDGLVANFKAGQDGVADALGVDDKYWRMKWEFSEETTPDGAVTVSLEVAS